MRMCSSLVLISCNAALRGRREGGGGRKIGMKMYMQYMQSMREVNEAH